MSDRQHSVTLSTIGHYFPLCAVLATFWPIPLVNTTFPEPNPTNINANIFEMFFRFFTSGQKQTLIQKLQRVDDRLEMKPKHQFWDKFLFGTRI